MDLKISTRNEGAVTLLELDGALTIGESEDAFREKVAQLLKAKKTSILVNFDKVEFVDSSGVGALIKCLTSVTKAGGKIKGLKPSPMVQKILKITGVYNLFEFFDDEARGVGSF